LTATPLGPKSSALAALFFVHHRLHRMKLNRKSWIGLLIAAALLAPIAARTLRWIDIHWLHESLKDTWGQWTSDEDWATLSPLPPNLSTQWLASPRLNGLLPIAHALGASGAPNANTLQAFQDAAAQGFKLFEVDLQVDTEGRLRCHHGPESLPAFNPQSSCTLDRLLPWVRAANAWLVLDIKNDFEGTANRVAEVVRANGGADRVVFQLYRPKDVIWFQRTAPQLGLPAPIVTAYVSRRSINHIAAQAHRIGLHALTLPVFKLPSLASKPSGVQLLVHPVHDCDDWRDARPYGVQGIYTLTRTHLEACTR
jgi:glycerophosphoryl diester phosphodiesterase